MSPVPRPDIIAQAAPITSCALFIVAPLIVIAVMYAGAWFWRRRSIARVPGPRRIVVRDRPAASPAAPPSAASRPGSQAAEDNP